MDRVYAVVLRSAEEARLVHDSLAEAFGEGSVVAIRNNSLVMVDADTTPNKVAEEAGISEDRTGIVMELGGRYAGYMPKRFWEWLRAHK